MSSQSDVRTYSLIVLSRNEQERIGPCVGDLINEFAGQTRITVEIILVDDVSEDSTWAMITRLVDETTHEVPIRAVRRSGRCGPGRAARDGLLASCGDYVMFLPGNGSVPAGEVARLLDVHSGLDDEQVERTLVISETVNSRMRPTYRRLLSVAHTKVWQAASGIDVRYINGTAVYARSTLAMIPRFASNHAYSAEMSAFAATQSTVIQVPITIQRFQSRSEAVSLVNLRDIAFALVRTLRRRLGSGSDSRPVLSGEGRRRVR